MVDWSKHCCDLDNSTLTIFTDHFEGKLSRKKSVLVRCKALKLFFNTLTADDKSSFINRDNLKQPIGTQLPLKQALFSRFFLAFSKSTLNFEHFQKKDDPHS